MTDYYNFIILICFFIIALVLTIVSLIWKQISLAMAGAVIWIILGLNRLLVSGDLTTLNGGIGLVSLVMGVLTGLLPYLTRVKPKENDPLSKGEELNSRLSKYDTIINKKNTVNRRSQAWYNEDEE